MAPSDMAKKWRAEYKQSPDYVQCRTCLFSIGQQSFCLINRLPAFLSLFSEEFDCYQNVWHHAACIFEEKKRICEFRNGTVVWITEKFMIGTMLKERIPLSKLDWFAKVVRKGLTRVRQSSRTLRVLEMDAFSIHNGITPIVSVQSFQKDYNCLDFHLQPRRQSEHYPVRLFGSLLLAVRQMQRFLLIKRRLFQR